MTDFVIFPQFFRNLLQEFKPYEFDINEFCTIYVHHYVTATYGNQDKYRTKEKLDIIKNLIMTDITTRIGELAIIRQAKTIEFKSPDDFNPLANVAIKMTTDYIDEKPEWKFKNYCDLKDKINQKLLERTLETASIDRIILQSYNKFELEQFCNQINPDDIGPNLRKNKIRMTLNRLLADLSDPIQRTMTTIQRNERKQEIIQEQLNRYAIEQVLLQDIKEALKINEHYQQIALTEFNEMKQMIENDEKLARQLQMETDELMAQRLHAAENP